MKIIAQTIDLVWSLALLVIGYYVVSFLLGFVLVAAGVVVFWFAHFFQGDAPVNQYPDDVSCVQSYRGQYDCN